MSSQEYPRPEDFAAMGELVDAAYKESPDKAVQDDVRAFYQRAAEDMDDPTNSEHYGSEANQVYMIAMFLRHEAETRLTEADEQKGTSEKRHLEGLVRKNERRLELIHDLIDPESANQTVTEMLEQLREYVADIKEQTDFTDRDGQKLLGEYEDLERFLVQFNNPKSLEDFRQDNYSYRSWLETGEI